MASSLQSLSIQSTLKRHSNERRSTRRNHLYAILDTSNKEIYKIGITSTGLTKDGVPKRAQYQCNQLNTLEPDRFKPVLLIKDLPNRQIALLIEVLFVELYKKLQGDLPGNRRF